MSVYAIDKGDGKVAEKRSSHLHLSLTNLHTFASPATLSRGTATFLGGRFYYMTPAKLVKHCKLRPVNKTLFAANGTQFKIEGEQDDTLYINGHAFHARALVPRNVTEPILGVDWLTEHDCQWNFEGEQVCKYGTAFHLSRRAGPAFCRRIIVQTRTEIPARSVFTESGLVKVESLVNAVESDWMTEAHLDGRGVCVFPAPSSRAALSTFQCR